LIMVSPSTKVIPPPCICRRCRPSALAPFIAAHSRRCAAHWNRQPEITHESAVRPSTAAYRIFIGGQRRAGERADGCSGIRKNAGGGIDRSAQSVCRGQILQGGA